MALYVGCKVADVIAMRSANAKVRAFASSGAGQALRCCWGWERSGNAFTLAANLSRRCEQGCLGSITKYITLECIQYAAFDALGYMLDGMADTIGRAHPHVLTESRA